jgi:hypothetical protein
MTYRQGCGYAAVLGVPCLIYDLLVRIPPLYHVEAAHALARIILFPGWQVVHWLTSGLMARNVEYKLLLPLLIVAINILVWGAVVWSLGNLVEATRRPA